jgi:signal transduction histidine kinase
MRLPAESTSDELERLREAVRARDDFLAVAAHELRSPMNALALRLELLERMADDDAPPHLADALRQARRSAERYVRRCTILLDVVRANSGLLQPHAVPVDVRALVEQVVRDHADEAGFRGVTLTAQVAGDATGRWDEHMAEQVLANLVGNAIKYGEGSPVVLRARVEGPDAIFEVEDRGPGIAAEDRHRIFGRFERLVAGQRYRSGYGLGLWIVGSMVAAHGGTVDVDSAPGRGTVFRVTMPLEGPKRTGDDNTAG